MLGPGGRRLWVSWNEGVTLGDITAGLLGPILGCLLRLLGRTFLHGSAVAVEGRVLAFLGTRGAGKSTTALALVQRGAAMVTDDLVLLEESEAGFDIPPGPPSLRLRPDPAGVLCGSFEALRPVWSDESRPRKGCLDIPTAERTSEPQKLEAVYVLGERRSTGPDCEVVPMRPAEALSVLMAQRSGTFLLDQAAHARDLALLGRLTRTVPVRRVLRREGLDGLREIADTLLADGLGGLPDLRRPMTAGGSMRS
ncbi:MAG: serine/threonine protein kinase [Gemmatimonadales bacterium]